jgi:hypothetical protein
VVGKLGTARWRGFGGWGAVFLIQRTSIRASSSKCTCYEGKRRWLGVEMQCSVFCTAAMLRQAARLRSCSITAALGVGEGFTRQSRWISNAARAASWQIAVMLQTRSSNEILTALLAIHPSLQLAHRLASRLFLFGANHGETHSFRDPALTVR